MKKNKIKKILSFTGCILTGIVFVFSVLLYVVSCWAKKTFDVGLREILFTLSSPLKGAGNGIVMQGVNECALPVVFALCSYIAIVAVDIILKTNINIFITIRSKTLKLNIRKFIRKAIVILTIIAFVSSLIYVEQQYQIIDFAKTSFDKTLIYEDYYIHPGSANISADGDEKNLICIFLESMETTYASTDVGGSQEINYIPNLTKIANENISFSNSDKIGGFHPANGTTWTMGALMAITSGIPFSFPVEGNSMNLHENFAPGLVNLGDILDKHNYNQYFLCGSDAEFGGRKSYFQQHGNYNIIDLFTARKKGYIPSDYFVWWGFEDKYLFEIAKKEITEISKNDQPFNFTMLTVDAHHMHGYICSECKNEYASTTANVVSCTDKFVKDFIDWCKLQPFYDDTAIIIVGDHPRMDTNLVENTKFYDRTMFNCFINCDKTENVNLKNREFTTLDLFPTILSAIGFEFDGSRLGLGTDMFSGEPTLAEELGFEYFNSELLKHSKYYNDNFS